ASTFTSSGSAAPPISASVPAGPGSSGLACSSSTSRGIAGAASGPRSPSARTVADCRGASTSRTASSTWPAATRRGVRQQDQPAGPRRAPAVALLQRSGSGRAGPPLRAAAVGALGAAAGWPGAALLSGPGLVDRQAAAAQVAAVQRGNGLLAPRAHLD